MTGFYRKSSDSSAVQNGGRKWAQEGRFVNLVMERHFIVVCQRIKFRKKNNQQNCRADGLPTSTISKNEFFRTIFLSKCLLAAVFLLNFSNFVVKSLSENEGNKGWKV